MLAVIKISTSVLQYDALLIKIICFKLFFFYLFTKEHGRAEADFGRFDVKRVVRTIYILFSRCEMPIAPEGKEIMDLADLSVPLPEWFTEEDLSMYASLYEKNGFTYPLQIPYR
jgi:hypothetical protein